MDDRLDLDYTSQAGTPKIPEVTSQDEADLSTLTRVQSHLGELIHQYRGVEMLDLEEKELSVNQQIKVNQVIVAELQSIKDAIDVTIDNVNEINKGEDE